MRRAVLLALVAVLVAAFVAFQNTLAWVGQQGPLIPYIPMAATCGQTAALTTPAEVGSTVAKSLGGMVHDAATQPPPSTAAVKGIVDGVLGVVESWWADFTGAARGDQAPSKGPKLLHQYPPGDPRGNPNLAAYTCCTGAAVPTAHRAPAGTTGPALARAAAAAAGFTGADLDDAVKIAGAESSYSPTATHHNTNGSTDFGEWQINSIHHAELAAGDWRDPYDNAQMAYSVWTAAGRHWTPWSTFISGAYLSQPTGSGTATTQTVAATCATSGTVEASFTVGTTTTVTDPSSGKSYTIAIPKGQAGEAVTFALAQLGEPYRWGGTGPSSWDCSGLTQAAWRAAGVAIPRNSEGQHAGLPAAAGAPVPGDIWWHVGHVQLYLGTVNGVDLILEAPETGKDVRIVPEWQTPSARMRPTGGNLS